MNVIKIFNHNTALSQESPITSSPPPEIQLPIIERGTHIPHVIYQTWETKELPDVMQRLQNLLKHENPKFEIKLFDKNERREFIQKYFPNEILYAYDTLIPGAFQADLWRYCVLYMYGGVYVDISWYPAPGRSFETMIGQEHYCKDWPGNFINGRGVINGLLMVYAGNPYLKEAITQIYKNCVNKTYNVHNSLYITGPGLLSEIISSDLLFSWYYSPDNIIRSIKDNSIIIRKSSECHAWMYEYFKLNGAESYPAAFSNKRVYR